MNKASLPLGMILALLLLTACTDSPVSQESRKHVPSFSAAIGSLKSAPVEPIIENGVAVKPAVPRQPAKVNERLSVYSYSSGTDATGILASHGRIVTRHELAAQWIEDTLEHSVSTGSYAVIIDKGNYRLHLVKSGEVHSTCAVELGANPVDDKRMEGDMCTPEGIYHATDKRDIGETQYYRGFLLDYPNSQDRVKFRHWKSSGQLPADATIGGGIMLHGLGAGKAPGAGGENWTHGCIALSDEDMDALFPDIAVGTWVTIVPQCDLD